MQCTHALRYLNGRTDRSLNTHTFFAWIALGIWQSYVFYVFAASLVATPRFDGKMEDVWAFGTTVYSFLVLATNATVALMTRLWTKYHVWALAISIGTYFVTVWLLCAFPYTDVGEALVFQKDALGVWDYVSAKGGFYLATPVSNMNNQ